MSLELSGTTPASKGVAGSVSAPAITGDDADTGISFPSANTIKFSTNGVERISITDAGISGTGISAGITMAQRWVFTSDVAFGSSFGIISSNLSARSASIGSSMTQSSGVFTFPTTGIYKISFYGIWLDTAAANDYLGQIIEISTDSGSNFAQATTGWVEGSINRYASQTVSCFFDVTNVSTHRARFSAQSQGNGNAKMFGSPSTVDYNFLEFIRLGDT